MLTLPIDSLREEFLAKLPYSNLVVEAETGSGKSTRLPIWASEQGRVLVVEPRRIACTSLAQFLAAQKEEKVGQSIGYAIKLENHFNDDTQVVFVTPGVALRWFADGQLKGFDTVIVDEFHERRWDTDLLVSLLKERRTHRVVITSATIEGNKLAKYIGAERMYASGRNYDVSIGHRAGDSRQLPGSRNLEQKVKAEVEALLEVDGDILVFLPGRKEIAQCQSVLKSINGICVAPLHASVSDELRDVALTTQAVKKVVLATNVAETSLTIPNIVAVIDSGLERRTEQRNGRTVLSLKHISKASAKQRAGRAGRVMDGICIRLYGEHAALSEVTPPELHRESLTEAMLAAASCGRRLAALSFLDPLPDRTLIQAEQTLVKMGAIDREGLVTEHGSKLYPLPIDALYADLVTRMPTRALQEAMVDLTAVLATPASLYKLNNSEEDQEKLLKQEPFGCDAQIAIRTLRGERLPGVNVDPETLKEARALARQMREVFELPQLSVASRYKRNELVEAITRLHPELVFVRREKRQEAMANGEMEVLLSREHRMLDSVQAALVLNTHSVPGRGVKQTLNLATFTMPMPLEIIEKLSLGEWREGRVINDTNGKPLIELELVYAGRVVITRIEEAQGELAIKPLIESVQAGRVMAGFAKQRTEEIEHWKLYCSLGLAEGEQANELLTFESWFTEQLTLLELNDVEELEMFSAEDFAFDGIPYWEYQEFAALYPFELALGDLNLTVEYHPSRKLIYVVYKDGLRKGYPKRWELPKWLGWRVQFKRASKIVDIK